MLDWTTCQAVERDPLKVSGAWVFRGTRVPVSALFENIEGGATVDQFVQWFPGVAREQIDADLAATYGVETRVLNQAVKRNQERFPGDFVFPLSAAEKEAVENIRDAIREYLSVVEDQLRGENIREIEVTV